MSSSPAAPALELNPPKGAPAYQAFTLFGPAAEPRTSAGKTPVVAVLHGFLSAIPNGTYKRIYKKLRKTHRVIGINYDPLDVEGSARFLRQDVVPALAGSQLTVVGTSLGGWWALHLAMWAEAERIVLINPVLDPEPQLRKHVGAVRLNPRRDVHYSTTVEAITPYSRIGWASPGSVPTLLLLCRDDELVDYRRAAEALGPRPSTTVIIYDEGGHTIPLKRHPALGHIARFVRAPGLNP